MRQCLIRSVGLARDVRSSGPSLGRPRSRCGRDAGEGLDNTDYDGESATAHPSRASPRTCGSG